jgi:hypothetical protein
MTKHVEREPTNQATELKNEVTDLTADEMERVSGGLVFTFKLVAVKTISWAHD